MSCLNAGLVASLKKALQTFVTEALDHYQIVVRSASNYKFLFGTMTTGPQTFEAAIIDLDGTMVDTMGDFVVAVNLMLRDLGYAPVNRTVVELRVGKGSENLVQSVLNHAAAQLIQARAAPDNIAIFEQALASYQQHYRTSNGQHA